MARRGHAHQEEPLSPAPRTLGPEPLPSGLAVPAPGEVPHVWALRVSSYADALPNSLVLLDAAERERHKAFVRAADRASYAAAHVALRRLLGAYADADPAALEFTRETCPVCAGAHGRPALAGGAGPHFSLSHSADMVLIAVAGTPVGADVERIPEGRFVDDVARSLHPRERDELAALPAQERRAAFARCWTRKEAYLKGTGEGLAGDPARDYVGSGDAPATLPGWSLADWTVDEGYAAAVAVADSV
ncbi:4'-phosphopantetheinyl transferase superfamily protein [Streptantibioticus parmotrematis]|uniref:4'-phosphopantetheinyl transferase family protein n=1 Tax=Streptantibioticus parmotrematis TaxID=2873249 RepID=UPI0033D3F3A1